MFTNYNKCVINDSCELPYNILVELQNPVQLIIGMAMIKEEDEQYSKTFSKEIAELNKFKYQDSSINSIKLYDPEGTLSRTFRKYNNIINVAHNIYQGKEKNYDIIITFGK